MRKAGGKSLDSIALPTGGAGDELLVAVHGGRTIDRDRSTTRFRSEYHMQIHVYALAAQGIGPDHPLNHDILVQRLREPLLAAAQMAVMDGDLSCHTALDGGWWVPRAQLAAVVGFGRKLCDPLDCFFIPPEAVLSVPYLPEPITEAVAAASPYQCRALTTARYMADYLAALRAAMPPPPYDLHVFARDRASLLPALARTGCIAAFHSDHGWWVIAEQVRELAPPGQDVTDLQSPWYFDPHNRADHGEVDRLSEEHRRNWPEIYGEERAPSARCPITAHLTR